MKLLIGGDTCITKEAWSKYKLNGIDGLFDLNIRELFKKVDASILNIECPLTETDKIILKCGPNHKINKQAVSIFNDLGLTYASIANNHILDFGEDGLNDTEEILLKNDIKLIGVNKENGYSQIIEKSGCKVGIISFADDEFNGLINSNDRVNLYDPLITFDQIKSLKERCDYVVVLFHSGLEHYEYPTPYIQRICRKMIESGASFITCQHSHCIGAYEEYNKGVILYGQGNFHFFREKNKTQKWNSAILVELNFSKNKMEMPIWHFLISEDGCVSQKKEKLKVSEEFYFRTEQIKDNSIIIQKFDKYCNETMKAVEISFLRGSSELKYYFHKLTKCKFMKIELFPKKSIAMSNIIRCTVHNEVIKCILKKINFQN